MTDNKRDPSNVELLNDILKGDAEAKAEGERLLFERHTPVIREMVAKFVKKRHSGFPPELIGDVVGDICLNILANLPKLLDLTKFVNWRNVIVWNTVKSHMRDWIEAQNKSREFEETLPDARVHDFEELLDAGFEGEKILKIVREISPKFYKVFYLRVVEELDFAEIAAILETTFDSVHSRFYRGFAVLEDRLRELQEKSRGKK